MLQIVDSPSIPSPSPPFSPAVEPVLAACCVSVALGERDILRDVNLHLEPGEILAIIGPSGCGKSTLITALNGMIRHTLPEARVDGTIRLRGACVAEGAAGQDVLRRKVAMVFQRPNPFPFSIRRNMEFALKAAGLTDRADWSERIEEALASVELWTKLKDRLSDPATCLSGGEQQRLCIARALVSDPDVILLDEPCSALDPVSSKAIETLVLALKRRASIGIVTHNLAQAQRVSDRCVFMWSEGEEGRVFETGATDDVIRNPSHPLTRAYVTGEAG